ncbi:peptidoglycan DD-metalloendopeptidase family protein [Candidatus Saccharibacteria bacterium]|nr:peptidoglycan DD-metalloendopeptidase family protein [Candidatus Saccharibacteria bacterium]
MKKNQSGFAHIFIVLIIIVVIGIIGLVFWRVTSNKQSSSVPGEVTVDTPKIKDLGINLDYYNEATGMAGDIAFIKLPAVPGGIEAPFLEYGRYTPESSAGPARLNPQPTFLAPLGTKVRSLVDGKVVNVSKLYSGDYAIHVQPEGSDIIFDLEHVINVKVKVGDTVRAGQEVAEVSDYDSRNIGGLGLYEIGVFFPGDPPKHACTFDYLDDSIKAETLKKLSALQDSWEQFIGNTSIYDQAAAPIPGCATRDLVEG